MNYPRHGRKIQDVTVCLYECTYKCGHLWVASKDQECPNCGHFYKNIIVSNIHPKLNFTKMSVVTFGRSKFYGMLTDIWKRYTKDSLIKELETSGFKETNVWDEQILMENGLKEVAVFNFSKQRKITSLYIGLHTSNDPLLVKLKACAKQDKANKKNEVINKKPQIKSMKDALGNNVVVGDWVCVWSVRSLTFGRVKEIVEFKEHDYDAAVKVGARVYKGNVILPYKTSEQIHLLTPEQSLLMALEQ